MEKNSFVFYSTYLEYFEMLTDEEAGKLIKAILQHVSGLKKDAEHLSPAAKMAFSFIKNQIARDAEAYENKCNKNRENGKKGGRPKKPNGYFENRTVIEETEQLPKKPNGYFENPNDNEYDNEYEYDNDNNKKYKKGFLDFWEVYPRKVDKGNAYKKYNARIIDGYSDGDLLLAATNYAEQCKREKTEAKFIKHPKTFLSDAMPFVDYLEKRDKKQKASVKDGENPFLDALETN